MTTTELKYLNLLGTQFPNRAAVASEIINLQAILNLPKGTEHFLADIHGEYEAFIHVLKNASGNIRLKVNSLFKGHIREQEIRELCTLIYYPKESLERIREREGEAMDSWYMVALNQLIKVCQRVTEKYTRSKVRKALPKQYSYILQELLHEDTLNPQKSSYLTSIMQSIIETGQADDFIIALSETIQRMAIDHLHVVGDVYDRGPGAHIIMDKLMDYHQVDFQWGNHDMLWMGAAVGNLACMANVIRIALRYTNLETIEDGYGINLLPLARFAMEVYKKDPCERFASKSKDASLLYDEKNLYMLSQMHKAISIIQFKLEAEIIKRHPEYVMDDRNLLHLINQEEGTITLLDGTTYPLLDTHFPTIDPQNPYELTAEEKEVVARLHLSFTQSEKLRQHVDFLYRNGGMYLAYNQNLLFHASLPMTEDREFKEVLVGKQRYKGKALMEEVDAIVRRAHWSEVGKADYLEAQDYMWYLWCGPDSPLFDKSAMTTFERYFIADKKTHHEAKGYYYIYRLEAEVCERILAEFGLSSPDTHIINGHVPVKASRGENPLQSGGKLMLIDGGFSKAYQSDTGIAGYTLIFNSHGLKLVKHDPFSSTQRAIEDMEDIESESVVSEFSSHRMLVRDTDKGKILIEQIEDLKNLLDAYHKGIIQERN